MKPTTTALDRPARTAREYLERIPKRLQALITGTEDDVRAALDAGDAARLEEMAGRANGLRIEGRPVDAAEVELSAAQTIKELETARILSSSHRVRVREEVLDGRLVGEFFFAGAATRFAAVAQGPLYFLDLWQVAERVLAAGPSAVPEFAQGMKLADYEKVHSVTSRIAESVPVARRVPLPLGPRILAGYRASLERLARESLRSPAEAVGRARLVIHVPESDDGHGMVADLRRRRFLGFRPQNVFFVPQPCFGGFRIEGDRVESIPKSREFPYGHGYSTMQLVQDNAAATVSDEGDGLTPIKGDLLSHLEKGGEFTLRTHRVNDLTQLTAAILDVDRLAAAKALLDDGHAVVIELVANPAGQKGGNWVSLRGGDHRFLIEGLNAKTGTWPSFLDRHKGAPYNAFRNLYRGSALRRILEERALPDHLRIRKLSGPGAIKVGLYLEAVTGDITQIAAARAVAFRRDLQEEIHDLKELKDLPDGLGYVAAQDGDEEFRRIATPG